MVLAVEEEIAGDVLRYINQNTEDEAVALGNVIDGTEGVILA